MNSHPRWLIGAGLAMCFTAGGTTVSAEIMEDFESYDSTETFSNGDELEGGLSVGLQEGGASDPAFAEIGAASGNQFLNVGTGGDDTFTSAHQDPYEDGLAYVVENQTLTLGSAAETRGADFSQSVFGFRAAHGAMIGLVDGTEDLSSGLTFSQMNSNRVLTVEFGYSGGHEADGSGKTLTVYVRRTNTSGNIEGFDGTGFATGGGVVAADWDEDSQYRVELSMTATAIQFEVVDLSDASTLVSGTSLLADTQSFANARFVAGDVLSDDIAGSVFQLDNIVVPEPGSLSLLTLGLGALLARKRSR